jgi:hypothetical protein
VRTAGGLEALRIARLDGSNDRSVLSDLRRRIRRVDLIGEHDAPRQRLQPFKLAQQHLVSAPGEDSLVEGYVRLCNSDRIPYGDCFSQKVERLLYLRK